MPHPLLEIQAIQESPAEYLNRTCHVFTVFDHHTQDSGNVSYGVEVDNRRFFIKTAGFPEDPRPSLSHKQRIGYLVNAANLACSCDHPALPRLLHVIQSPHGPLLVYTWATGELLHTTRTERSDPRSAYQRFMHLPAGKIMLALDTLYALNVQLVQQGWIALDFYDGCLIYDFAAGRLHVVDLDMYHEGPFTNTIGRLFGSSRFMAPEEFTLNALIDERTTVYSMGRTAVVFLSDGTLSRQAFRGSDQVYGVIVRACAELPEDRYQSMTAFYAAWCAARMLV